MIDLQSFSHHTTRMRWNYTPRRVSKALVTMLAIIFTLLIVHAPLRVLIAIPFLGVGVGAVISWICRRERDRSVRLFGENFGVVLETGLQRKKMDHVVRDRSSAHSQALEIVACQEELAVFPQHAAAAQAPVAGDQI